MGFKDLTSAKKGLIIGLLIGLIAVVFLLMGYYLSSQVDMYSKRPVGMSPCDMNPFACHGGVIIQMIGSVLGLGGLILTPILAIIICAINPDATCAMAGFFLSPFLSPIVYAIIGYFIGRNIDKRKIKSKINK